MLRYHDDLDSKVTFTHTAREQVLGTKGVLIKEPGLFDFYATPFSSKTMVIWDKPEEIEVLGDLMADAAAFEKRTDEEHAERTARCFLVEKVAFMTKKMNEFNQKVKMPRYRGQFKKWYDTIGCQQFNSVESLQIKKDWTPVLNNLLWLQSLVKELPKSSFERNRTKV